jgi:hypothetical protein
MSIEGAPGSALSPEDRQRWKDGVESMREKFDGAAKWPLKEGLEIKPNQDISDLY